MTGRKIRNELIEYVVPILSDKKIAYILHEKKDYSTIETNLSSEKFHRLIEKAMCEQESKEYHNGRQVISYYEWRNRLYDDKSFHILRKDKERYLSEFAW